MFSHTPRDIREMTKPPYFEYAIGESVSDGGFKRKADTGWGVCVFLKNSGCQFAVHHCRWIDLCSPCAFGGYGCLLCLLVLFRRRKWCS